MRDFSGKFFFSLIVSLTLASCDYIDEPVRAPGGGGGGGGNDTIKNQPVLIEKFTGHRCNNCPEAEQTAKVLKDQYGDEVITISYHVLINFAGPRPDMPNDFRTPEGTQIFEYFRFVGIPNGMINRLDYTQNGTGHHKGHGSWASYLANEFAREAMFEINVTTDWENRNSKVNVEVTALNNYSDEIRLVVAATEDNIVSPQIMKDYSKNEDYVHNNMFRFSYTPALGTDIGNNWQLGQTETIQLEKNLSTDYNENAMNITAYVLNKANQRILSVKRVSLLP